MEKKKVYFVLPSLSGGGAERVAVILLKHIDRQSFVPSLVLFNKTGEFLDIVPQDVTIIDLCKKNKFSVFRLIFKLRQIINKDKPDVVISFLEYANYIMIIAALLITNRPRIIISERNDIGMYQHHERAMVLKQFLMYFTYRYADRTIAVSQGVKESLMRILRLPNDKISVLYNPIDLEKIASLSKEPLDAESIDMYRQKPVIISAGRFVRQKNLELLIQAFSLLREKMEATLILLGKGERKNELMNLSERLGISKYVFFPGFQKNPFAWIKHADLFVLSSDWEGFPNVIVEAMACDVPVVATDCRSGPSEIIENGINGILVPPGNAELLCHAMLEVLSDQEIKAKLVNNARQSLQRFSASVIVQKYETVFNNVLKDKINNPLN